MVVLTARSLAALLPAARSLAALSRPALYPAPARALMVGAEGLHLLPLLRR